MNQSSRNTESVVNVGEALNDSIESMKKTIGSNIRSCRKAKRISQYQLSEMTGLHRTYISDLENAKCNPTLNVLMVVADRLGISLGQLLGL